MVGKNNKQARWSKSANTFKRYSLKKLSVGVASVVIGTGVAWASSTTVHAAEEGTEVVTGDGEKEEPVESAVPTEAPVVDGDESSSHDAVADLVNEIRAAEEPASEAADVVEPRGANESSDNGYEPIPSDAIEGAAETSDEEKNATSKPTSDDANELESDEEESRIQPRSSRPRAAREAEAAEADKLAGKYQPYVGSTLAKAQFKRVPEALDYIQNREDLKKEGQSVIKSAEWVDKEVFKKAGRQSTKIKVTYTDGSEDIVDIRLLINNGYKIGNQEYTGTKASEMFGLQTEKDGNIALGLNTPDARQKEVRDKKSIEFEITTQMGFNRAGRNEYAYFELSDNLARHVTSVVDTTNSEDSIPWERVRSHTGALTNTWRKKYATGPAKARRGEALFNGAVPTVSQTAKVRFDLKKTLGEIIKQENITKNSDIQAEVFVYNEDKARAKNGTHIHQNVLVKDRYGNNVPDSTKAADSIRSSAINSYFDKNIGPNGAFVFDHHFNKKVLNINNHPHQYQYHYKIDERLAPYISDTKVYYLNDGGSGLDFRENAENSDELRKVFENEGPARKRNGWSGFEAQYNNGQRTNSWITKGTEIVENPQGHNFGIDRQLNTGEGYYRLTNWLANPLSRQMNFLNSSALNAGTRVAFLLKEGQTLDDVLRAFRGEKFTYEGYLKLTARDGNVQPGTRGSGYYEVLDLDGDGRADEGTPYDSNISIDTTYENANKITGSALSGIKSATSDNANDGAPLSVYRIKNGQREKIGETKVKANGTYEISVPEGKQLQKDDVLEVEAVDNEGNTVRNRTTVLPLPDNQKYEPTGKNGEVPKNSQPVAEDFINNIDTLPDNSKYDWEKPVDTSTTGEKDGTVIVTYPDGTQDKVNVKVTVVEGSKKADEVEPKYENPSSGSLKSDEPKFHAQGNPDEQKDKPANTRFGKGKNAPEGVSVDSETGVVTLDNPVTVETKVPVEVTYEDGSTDTTSVTFTPEKPVADDLGYPEEVTIEETDEGSARTKQTGEPNLPDAVNKANGDKFRFNKDVPEGFTHGNDNGTELVFNGGTADDPSDDVTLTIDPNTGNITVKGEDKADTRKPFDIPVEYVSEDGKLKGSDVVSVQVKPKAEAETPAPSIERAETPTHVTEGEEKALEDKVNNPTDGMTGTITDGEGNEIQGGTVTVDGNTGEIKVQVPTNTVPEDQDSIPGKVQIKDNNGENVGGPIDITIDKAKDETPAPSISDYEDKTITEGRPIEPITPEITNKGEGDITENGLPDGLNINPETGEITGTPDVKDWKDNFDKEKPNSSDFEEERDFTVTVTVPGQPERTAEFTITVQRDTDGDGIADVNDPDSDGDGINDNVELERGTNPKDANDFKGPELSVNTPKKDEETVSGKTEPDTPVTVKDTDGKIIGQGVSDEEGNFKVPVERPLKGGEELDVTAGDPNTENDQTTDRVTVYTPQSDIYEPQGNPIFVEKNGTPNATDGIANKDELPEGTKFEFDGPVDTSTPGKKDVNVKITYPDGSEESITVPLHVSDEDTPQSEIFEPRGQDIEVPEGAELDAANGIANKDELPEGTEFEFDGPVDTSTPGEKKAKVIVAYPDGSTDTVDITVNVTEVPTQADKHEPKGQDIEVPEGAEPDAANGIANKDELPEGTEFEFDGPVDTSTPGEKKAKVIVAYPDGSTDTVDITVNVTEVPTQANNHEPQGNPIFVEKNGTPNAADGIANKDELPEGTEFEFDGPVDTSTPGEKKAKVIVAYPDGSTDTVDVTVNVTDGDTPQSEIFEPQGQDIEVPEGGQPNAADGIANKDELPEGTEFEFDGPVDTSTPGKKKAKVIVAYPDGSTDTVDVTVNVTPKTPGKTTAETLEPKWNDSDAKDGGPVTVPNTGDKIPAGSKTTATITEDPNNKGKGNWTVTVGEDGSVTVTPGADAQPGDSATVTVETTYPDGSKDSSSFKVTVPEKGKTTAETLEPKWNDSDAKDGGPVTVPNTGDKIPAGSKTTATITEDPNNKGKGNWTVTVGEDGSVTVTPGADAQPGDSATVTVETTYPDGSKDSSSFKVTVPAVGPTHAHGDSLVHDKPSYDLDKLGHGQTQPSRPAEDKGQGQVQDKAQTPDVDKAGLPNYVPSQSGERLPDTATGAWVLGVVGLMSTGLGSALGLKRKKEDEE